MTEEEIERAQELIYRISPFEGPSRSPDDWTEEERTLVTRCIVYEIREMQRRKHNNEH